MASHDKWMPLDIGSYMGDTGHLTYDQHGPYLMLLMRYWKKGPLPNDDVVLARLCHVPFDIWDSGMGSVIRSFFVLQDDGLLHQKRADAEISKRKKVGEARRTAGKSGLAKRWKHGDPPTNEAQEGIKQEPIAIAISPEREIDSNCYNLPSICYVQVQEERKKEHKPSVYDASASPTPADHPDPPKPKPPPHPVWSEGLEILAWAAGRSLAKDRDPVVRLLRKCQEAALGDDDMLIGVLRTVHEDMAPEKQTIAVIKSLIAERGGAAIKGKTHARLVVDNKDPQGIQAWARSVPGARPTINTDTQFGNWLVHGWIIDHVAGRVAEAVELPGSCRFDWSLLIEWLSIGIDPDTILARIGTGIGWLRRQPDGYMPPSSLKLFDTFVRGARRVA